MLKLFSFSSMVASIVLVCLVNQSHGVDDEQEYTHEESIESGKSVGIGEMFNSLTKGLGEVSKGLGLESSSNCIETFDDEGESVMTCTPDTAQQSSEQTQQQAQPIQSEVDKAIETSTSVQDEIAKETAEKTILDAGSSDNQALIEHKQTQPSDSIFGQLFGQQTAKKTALTGNLRGALINLGKSQAIMAKALGLDEQAMLAEKNVTSMEKGDLGTSDEVDKAIEISTSVQNEISKETAKKTILDAGSKVVFVSSVPFYIKGVLGSVQTGKDAVAIGASLKNIDFGIIGRAQALLSIVTNLPTLISSLSGSTGQIMDFMTVNEMDTGEMDSQLANAF